jgi:hypothetical protein
MADPEINPTAGLKALYPFLQIKIRIGWLNVKPADYFLF